MGEIKQDLLKGNADFVGPIPNDTTTQIEVVGNDRKSEASRQPQEADRIRKLQSCTRYGYVANCARVLEFSKSDSGGFVNAKSVCSPCLDHG